MRPLISATRRAFTRIGVIAAPLVVASACTDSGKANFFDPPGAGRGGSAPSGGSGSGGAGAGAGGSAGSGSGGTANSTSAGAGGGGAGVDAAGAGGTTSAGGMSGAGGTAGDAPLGGNPGTAGDTAVTGGSGGTDAGAGEGGAGNEAGMGGSTTAGMGGDAGSSTSGMGGVSGVGASAGDSGSAGTAGAGMGGAAGGGCTPQKEVCDGEDNDCGEDRDEGDVCPPGCHGATFEGQTYLLCTPGDGFTWQQARTFCQDLSTDPAPTAVLTDMTLVEINSPEENQFLIDWIISDDITDSVWMGANDLEDEGSWEFDRGSLPPLPFLTVVNANRTIIDGRFNDFPTGVLTPAVGDCGIFDSTDDFHWDDRACSSDLDSFVCGEIP